MTVTRKLAAILAADVVGYGRLMGEDEAGTLETLKTRRKTILEPCVREHGGRIVKVMGDGVLIAFPSAVNAVQCAIALQQSMAEVNAGVPEERRIVLRIGVNLGDVIVEGGDLYGDGVNVAARLEALAEPGGICIAGAVYDQLKGKLAVGSEDIGRQELKNIGRPVQVYRVWPAATFADQGERENAAALPLSAKASIAVLPFTNMSGDPEQEYFADGLTEDIITALSRIRSLFVIARNSTFTYKGKAVDVKQVGRELGVRYVLEGSVRMAGSRIRVTGQLVDTSTAVHVWAERHDRDLTEIFDLQDELTRSLVASVETQVRLGEGDIAERIERPDLRVWSLSKRAWRRIYELTPDSLKEARHLAEEAVRLDSRSGLAHQVLSVAIHHLAFMNQGPEGRSEIARARALGERAVELDENDEYSHWALGNACMWLGDHERAIAAFRRSLELNPNCSLAYGSLGSAFCFAGRPRESIANNEIAIRSNPRDPSIFFRYAGLALAHFIAGEYQDAAACARKSVERKRGWYLGHVVLAASLASLLRNAEANAAIEDYRKILPGARIADLSRIPFKNAANFEQLAAALRLAGLPD